MTLRIVFQIFDLELNHLLNGNPTMLVSSDAQEIMTTKCDDSEYRIMMINQPQLLKMYHQAEHQCKLYNKAYRQRNKYSFVLNLLVAFIWSVLAVFISFYTGCVRGFHEIYSSHLYRMY